MWIKVCGVRDVSTALELSAVGVDAVGLNFYSASPRSVGVEVASAIVQALPRHVTPVGLFVNHALSDLLQIVRTCGLKTLQLHGDESPEYLAELQEYQLIRAFRPREGNFEVVDRYLAECRQLQVTLWGCLVDAHVAGSYGGTGATGDWSGLSAHPKAEWPRLILAGGLTPENVTSGIQAVHPWGVDTASGVESAPGVKEISLVRQFVSQVRSRA